MQELDEIPLVNKNRRSRWQEKVSMFVQEPVREKEEQGGQSSLFEPEQRRRLRIPLNCRIRYELRINVPLQRRRGGLR